MLQLYALPQTDPLQPHIILQGDRAPPPPTSLVFT
jgi:hypothetical protein